MPVTWEFPPPSAPQVLVLTLVGDYRLEDLERAVTEAAADPRFRAGASILLDGRLSEAKVTLGTTEELADWAASLRHRGLSSRLALVVSKEPYKFGMGRMLASRLGVLKVKADIFREYDGALAWLTAEPPGEG